jgi:phospholipase/carboxylesterase
MFSEDDPHADQPIFRTGPEIDQADAVAICLHGRGSTGQQILSLFDEIALERVAALAPQAATNTWYPNSFLAQIETNQPYLDSALRRVDSVLGTVLQTGTAADRILIIGFSQGACLASEYIARHPRRYGGVVILTGGLIGPPGTHRHYSGSLDGPPIFLGTSDPDPHVPFERVQETRSIFEHMGAAVELRRYAGMPHTVNKDELAAARTLLEAITTNERGARV